MTLEAKYDAIVIGAGQAGGPLATALGKAGMRTAIIEREHVGGTCINEGCTPTKTMVASARVAYLAKRGAGYGVHTGEVGVDMVRVRERKRAMVDDYRSSSERRLRSSAGVDLLMGSAAFTAPNSVRVALRDGDVRDPTAPRDLTAPLIVVNAGARPSAPAIPGLETVKTLDSTSIMELDTVPEHLLVIGGGYVGLEFGQMFRRFGSRVTIVQSGAQLLAREDPDVAGEVAKILGEDGIDVLLNTKTVRLAPGAAGGVVLSVQAAGAAAVRDLQGSHVLLAAGRAPNSDGLNLGAAGVETDRKGFIKVNERLETNVPGIYAVGDINGGPAFTHISYDDFRILRTNLIQGGGALTGGATTKERFVPYTVFIDPQLGRVGLSETDARGQGRHIQVAKIPMSYVARAQETDEQRGLMKAVVDADSGQILGCAILGIEGGEIMSAIQIAMMGRLPYTALRDATFAHPTLMESLNNLFGSL